MKYIETLNNISPSQTRRFINLPKDKQEIAFEGFKRYIRACRHQDITPAEIGLKEIIDDALVGRATYAEVNEDSNYINRRLPND